jgi:hypothetical protein
VISVLASGSSTLPTKASQKNRAASPILTYWFIGLNVASGRSGELTGIEENEKMLIQNSNEKTQFFLKVLGLDFHPSGKTYCEIL